MDTNVLDEVQSLVQRLGAFGKSLVGASPGTLEDNLEKAQGILSPGMSVTLPMQFMTWEQFVRKMDEIRNLGKYPHLVVRWNWMGAESQIRYDDGRVLNKYER